MSSINKQMTAHKALELIFDHNNEIKEDVSEDEDHLEANSVSDDSDYEPNEEASIHIPPSKAFTSKNGEIQWPHPQIYVCGGL